MDCGSCANGQSCGGAGIASVCGSALDSGLARRRNASRRTASTAASSATAAAARWIAAAAAQPELRRRRTHQRLRCGARFGALHASACTQMNGKYCGTVGDGCGGQQDCGGCPNGQTCGGDGIPNLCGSNPDAGTCTRLSCTVAGGKYCGTVGDGCGGQMDCGGCTGGQTCGGDGIANVCGSAPDSGLCTPTVCQQATGKYCGVVGDGCGGQTDCGGCPNGQTCGGGGLASICGAPVTSDACAATQCQQANGKYCGTIGNGCGGALDCGGCPNGQTCGARTAGVCNAPCPLCGSIQQCDGGTTASIKGVAYTGTLVNPDPIYNAVVYIPNVAQGHGACRRSATRWPAGSARR